MLVVTDARRTGGSGTKSNDEDDGLKQDEREFLKEFIIAGGGDCLDAVGYNALTNNTSGMYNTALGYGSLQLFR